MVTRNKKLLNYFVALRKSRGYLQRTLADKLRRPQSFVSKYESGERRIDLLEFIEICKAMNIDPNVAFVKLLEALGNDRSS